ncbi:SH3 domain-containing protein [Deminuibacter soli]|uniref:SH3 domain-containing protein n=1 Tax=Deminuibacter soli TaxID=2291815 RepID=A0A3E1NP58_9BACT|nr:SH3 domain-containing protein [Deminuibacter soli]RFM29604.1 SH3 domain-containing protein [Deminuibacter soli]
MSLQDKYKPLTDAATAAGVSDLQVREQDGILYIDGTATDGKTKDQLWDVYNQVDPDYRSGDLVLNINVTPAAAGSKATVVTDESNLNIRKGPGTDQPIVGKAAHGASVTLLNQTNDQWWLVKTESGEEGYAYARYLKAE